METFEWSYVGKFLPTILKLLPLTLQILLWVTLVSLCLGSLFAVLRLRQVPLLAPLVRLLVSYSRGVPEVTQLFILYYGLPKLLLLFQLDITRWPGLLFVVFTYGISVGAALSESLRVAFTNVDPGQKEAAWSLGMGAWATFWRVTFPLAMALVWPNYSNIVVRSLKNTSLAFSVGVIEMMTVGKQVGAAAMHPLEAYLALSLIYYSLYLLIVWLFRGIEPLLFKQIGGQKV